VRALERHKLIEASEYFIRHTRHCGLVKLFKLLYFLDMLNFRETGRTVTGLSYTALPYGPVPLPLLSEFREPRGDLAESFTIQFPPPKDLGEQAPARTVITPKGPEADRYLSVREKRISKELAEIFYEATADQMSDVSHAKNGPWDKARARTPGKWKEKIDFFDALSPTLKMGSGRALSRRLLELRATEFEEDRRVFE
jgi:uncharacterized phage-associated protein